MEKKIIKLDFSEDNSLSKDKPKKLSFFRKDREGFTPSYPSLSSELDKREKEIQEKLKIVREEIKQEKEKQRLEKEKINKQKEIKQPEYLRTLNSDIDLGEDRSLNNVPLNPFEWFNHKSCSNCGKKLKKSKVRTGINGELYQSFKCKKCNLEHEVRIKL